MFYVFCGLKAEPVPLPLRSERGFALDVDELAALITDRTRLVILNSPNNPTGAVIGDAELDGVAAVLERSGAWVLSDEVYAKIAYEGPVPSVASRPRSISHRGRLFPSAVVSLTPTMPPCR